MPLDRKNRPANQKKTMSDPEEASPTVQFHFIKTANYVAHHADGALGGPTPAGSLYLAFYAERGSIPQMIEHALSPDGTLGESVRVAGKKGIVREIQTGVVLNKTAAQNLVEFLQETLKSMETL